MTGHCPPACGHVHFSTLRYMARSPLHYLRARDEGAPQTEAMRLGSAVHNLILFDGRNVTVFDGATRRGKAWDEFLSVQDPAAIIMTQREHATAAEMAEAVMSYPRASEILAGMHEMTLDAEIGGLPCRGTPDVFAPGRVVELKTTTDASPARFTSQALRMFYHAQLSWYAEIINRAEPGGIQVEDGLIVAVESAPPYAVQTYRLTGNALDMGRRTWRSWIERLRVCEESGRFPSYCDEDVPLDCEEDFALTIGGESLSLESE